MRTDPDLARAIDDWFGAIHRVAAPPGRASIAGSPLTFRARTTARRPRPELIISLQKEST